MTYASREDLAERLHDEDLRRLIAVCPAAVDADDEDAVAAAAEVAAKATTARVTAALTDASSEIDAGLSISYALPLGGDAPYPALVAIACDLAYQRLHEEVSTEAVDARARRARKRLSALASGRSALLGADGAAVPRRVTAHAVTGPAPVMTYDRLAWVLG